MLITDGFIKNHRHLFLGAEIHQENALKSGRQPNVKDRKAFEEEFPGDMYQADTCHSIYITEGGRRRKTCWFQSLMTIPHDCGSTFFTGIPPQFQRVLKAVACYGIAVNFMWITVGLIPTLNKLILGSLGIIQIHAPVRDGGQS